MGEETNMKRTLENEDVSDATKPKRAKTFSSDSFRNELKGADAYKCVKNFVRIAQDENEGDVVEDYLNAGGSVQEMLLVLDQSAKADLTSALPVFKALHLILLRVKDNKSELYLSTEDGIKYMLRSFTPTIQGMININSVKHRKTILKLLSSIVTLFPSCARDIMALIPNVPHVINEFLSPALGSDTVRKWFILFILSFIVGGDITLIRPIMNMKGMIGNIARDLKYDDAYTVNLFLSVLKDKVLENIRISKALKLKVFNTQVIVALFELYNWKGPKNISPMNLVKKNKQIKEKEVNKNDKELVTESIHAFLSVLCTSVKFGVAFSDSSLGTSGEPKNNLLYTVIQSLSEPWEDEKMAQTIIAIVVACPNLLKVLLTKMESALKPRDSSKWNKILRFVENLLDSINPKDILKDAMKVAEIDLVRQAKELCTPAILIRHMGSGIRISTCLPILYYSMRILTLMWKNCDDVIKSFKNNLKLKKTLTSSFHSCLIDVDEMMMFWQTICGNSLSFDCVDKHQFLHVLLDYLHMSSECEKDSIDSPDIIAEGMLQHLEGCRDSLSDVHFTNLQSRIFHLVTQIDSVSITPKSDLFRKAVTVLVQNENCSTLESAARLILSTGVFENNESEVDVWLGCYYNGFHGYQDVIPDFLVDCISGLYLKEIDFGQNFIKSSSKKISMMEELMEVDSAELAKKKWMVAGSPTPMLIQSLELLKKKKFHSENGGNEEKLKSYISYVAARLFQYYNNSRALLKLCQNYKSQLSASVVEYMENSDVAELCSDDAYVTAAEKELMSWIVSEGRRLKFKKIARTDGRSILGLFLTFKMVTSYLFHRVSSDSLSEGDVAKLCKFFSFSIDCGAPGESNPDLDPARVLSYDARSFAAYRRKCIEALLSLPLPDEYNVFECENETAVNYTKLIASVIKGIPRDDLKDVDALKPWKEKFLENVKSSLDNRTMQVMENVQPFLDCFHFTPSEICDVLTWYCSVSDMSNFVSDGHVRMPTVIFTQFAKMQSNFSELNPEVIGQLSNITRSMMEEGLNLEEVVDECLFYVIQKRPKTLSLINNEFVEDCVRRAEFNPQCISLGKVLLSDPKKAGHFVKFGKDNFKDLKNKEGVVSLASSLFSDEEDDLVRFLKSKNIYSYWKDGEAPTDDGSDFTALLKLIFKKYKGHICAEPTSRKRQLISKHRKLFSLLLNRFLDKEEMMGLKDSISGGLLEPGLIHKAILKFHEEEDLMRAYVNGLLTILSDRAKEAEDGDCEESVWSEYGSYVRGLVEVGGFGGWNVITDSSLWKDFVRLSLRICFNAQQCPSFLRTVRLLIELLYNAEDNSPDIRQIFDMVISHSQFLNVILRGSELKLQLVKLYYSLIKRNSGVLSHKHIPVILASYTASLSECDVILLNIMKWYEACNVSMNEYEPLVWGEPAVSHYSVKTTVGVSLWRRINMLNILEFIDPKRLDISLKDFPIHRSPQNDSKITFDSGVYDPAFLLPMFSSLLSPGAVTYCSSFVQKGCFAYTLCSLSSSCKEIRMMASVVLSRFHTHLELAQNMKMKTIWLHFSNCLRYGISDISQKPLPSVFTYFIARASMEVSAEPDEMYAPLKNFLLAKPAFSFNSIPEFLPFFHSSDVCYQTQRRWILEVLRDGFKQNADLELFFQAMGVKIVLSNFRSQFCNRETKLLTLEVLTNLMRIGRSRLLISEYGLLTWLNAVCLNCDRELFAPFMKLMSVAWDTCARAFVKRTTMKRNALYPTQMLNILMKILPNLTQCNSAEALQQYLKVLLSCLVAKVRCKDSSWCKSNRRKLSEVGRAVVKMTGDEHLLEKYLGNSYYIPSGDSTDALEQSYKNICLVWQISLSRNK